MENAQHVEPSLQKRLEWRDIKMELTNVTVGEKFNSDDYDIVFIGGGQDFEQEILLADLTSDKRQNIKESINSNTVFLAICGGYQLLGTHYTTWDGHQYDFIGAIDIHTVGHEERMIGDYMFTCELTKNSEIIVAGFENHSGRTYLGPSVKPLGHIIKGFGNNGEDKTAGAHFNNVFCSYSHGPLLPKNPVLCDYILETALKNKYGDFTLSSLSDTEEKKALDLIIKRIS